MTHLSERAAFRWWMAGTGLSTLGDAVTFFALVWVASGRGPAVASLVVTAESIPLCLFILVGGAFADRFGARRVMIACDAFMALVMAALAMSALVSVPVWALVTVAFLSGTAAALRRPAAGAFPRLFFQGERLSKAMASTTLFQQVAQSSGPTVAGVLLAGGGLAVTAGADAVTFVAILLVLLVVRPPHEPMAAPGSSTAIRRQIADGVRAARNTPGATATMLTIVGMAVAVLPLVSLCVPLIGHARGWSAGQTGIVSGAWVVGGMAVMAVVSRRGMAGRRVAIAGPVLAASGVGLLGVTSSPVSAMAALVAVGAGTSMLTTRIFPLFMEATPRTLLSRFQSLLGLAQTGPVLLAMPLLGGLVALSGVRSALAGIAMVLLLTVWAASRADAQLAGARRTRQSPSIGSPDHRRSTADEALDVR